MHMVRREVVDLVDLLRVRADELPSHVAFRHLITGDIDGGVLEWSYGELDRRARMVAALFVGIAKPRDLALL